MQLIPTWSSLDFAIFPIGDNFTMDTEDAITAAEFVKVNKVVGVHFDTFGFIKIDKEKTKKAFKAAEKELLLPIIGESIDL
jgi:L-ascorbate metabolism protein UlaG (beta-lactamase superfamily)